MPHSRRYLPIPRFSRLSWLMGMYGDNFMRLSRLFKPQDLAVGVYESRVDSGLDLVVEVLERHAYTVELRLSYRLRDPVTGTPDPSAYLRLYRDARQVEVTHCYVGRSWQDVLGMRPDVQVMVSHRMRMNSFLSKWLEYLQEQGHGLGSLRACPPQAPEKENRICA